MLEWHHYIWRGQENLLTRQLVNQVFNDKTIAAFKVKE